MMDKKDWKKIGKEMDRRFKPFFQIVEQTAAQQNAVFFMDSGEGRDIVTDEFEGEDISGWLIPLEKEEEFAVQWRKGNKFIENRWNEYYLFAIWSLVDGKVEIEFKRFDW